MTDEPRLCAAGCDRIVIAPAVICTAHLRRTQQELDYLPTLLLELDVVLTRMARYVEQNGGGRTARSVDWSLIGTRYLDSLTPRELGRLDVAYARGASNALARIRALLIHWNGALTALGVAHVYDTDMPTLLGRLTQGVHLLVDHPDAGRLVTTLAAEVDEATKVVDAPQNRLRHRVGPCPEELAVEVGEYGAQRMEDCPGQVTATIPADDLIRPTMRCSYCRTTWLPEQWANVGDRILRKANAA